MNETLVPARVISVRYTRQMTSTRRLPLFIVIAILVVPFAVLPAQECNIDSATAHDSAYHAMQTRGTMAMGVDQYTSTHHFTDLADGGTIELERNADDSASVAMIRHHLHIIARAFEAGDFSTPMFVHMRNVPGTATMAAKRSLIDYTVSDLPRGGAVRITTHDPDALAAIHAFLAFQRSDHRARSRSQDHGPPSGTDSPIFSPSLHDRVAHAML
jgi:hypothetical protein